MPVPFLVHLHHSTLSADLDTAKRDLVIPRLEDTLGSSMGCRLTLAHKRTKCVGDPFVTHDDNT
ncbi:MAG: hypothetical protein IH991_05470 [Planctomycetes bacterium]|nr:hypothetical protein [Planctomycetota bacterium]